MATTPPAPDEANIAIVVPKAKSKAAGAVNALVPPETAKPKASLPPDHSAINVGACIRASPTTEAPSLEAILT